MNSHLDSDARRSQFLDELQRRAEHIKGEGRSQITGGKEGEESQAEWKSHGVNVRQLPDDDQGILRISIGGGANLPVAVNYCVFRGERSRCIDLLRKALKALENPTDS